MDAVGDFHGPETAPAARLARLSAVAPAAAAALYPIAIHGFRTLAAWDGDASLRLVGMATFLAAAFAVPAVSFFFSLRAARLTTAGIRARRIAFLAVTAPSLFVFSGVLFGVLGIAPWRDWVWFGAWTLLWIWAGILAPADAAVSPVPAPRWMGKLRVIHGVSAAAILLFVVFHLTNHLFALAGQETHTAIMAAGRKVYRAPVVEPVLIALVLFQAVSGLRLAWTWSTRPADRFRVFQMVSGFYVAVFVLVHMNSVLLYARLSEIETGWNFMTGQPAGLIHGAIYLVPHYALGVFFVLSHLASGARQVAVAHSLGGAATDRVWGASVATAAALSAAIITGIAH